MVANISYTSSLYGALAYNNDKVKRGEGEVLDANRIFLDGYARFDINSCIEDFERSMPSHISTQKPFVHISLNPHPDDKLSNFQLVDIANEYLDKMGFGRQPYVIFKHSDIDRHHLHIVTSAVDEEGKKLNLDNNFYKSKKILKELEQKYNLLPTERHEQKEAYRYKKIDPERGELKRQISSVLVPILKQYHFLSFNEYKTLLSTYNICVEEVKGNAGSRSYHGLIYHATDDEGNKIGKPFKSSLFGKAYGADAIYKRMEKSKEVMKADKMGSQTKRTILSAMSRCRSKVDLEKELSKRGIDMVLRHNQEGRLYGVTFIDHNQHAVFNGSRLGKELSANALAQWFENPQATTQAEHTEQPTQTQESPQYKFSHDDSGNSIMGLFDAPSSGGDDPEEEAFRKRMQRKKRRGRNYKL